MFYSLWLKGTDVKTLSPPAELKIGRNWIWNQIWLKTWVLSAYRKYFMFNILTFMQPRFHHLGVSQFFSWYLLGNEVVFLLFFLIFKTLVPSNNISLPFPPFFSSLPLFFLLFYFCVTIFEDWVVVEHSTCKKIQWYWSCLLGYLG